MTPKLKICKKERRFDLYLEEYVYVIESKGFDKYQVEVIRNEPNIFWRQNIWNLLIYRSMEIWKKIPNKKIENSIGTLTPQAKKSLSGKMGVANNKYFKKVDNNWIYFSPKENKYFKPFEPLSDNAILKCKERAKKYFR